MALQQYYNQMNNLSTEGKAFVKFVNKTNRIVDLYWLDQRGVQMYKVLHPYDQINVNTYCNHPWLFRDSNTGELMRVKHKKLFWPIPVKMRLVTKIHFPVRSLRDNCLWNIADTVFKNTNNTKLTIDALCIPNTLKHELNTVLDAIEIYRVRTEAIRQNI